MTGLRPSVRELGISPQTVGLPRARTGAFHRAALVEALCASSCTGIAMQAPAGYGKTTLALQWVERDARPAAWLTLDDGDSDPVVLIRHAVAALEDVVPVPESRCLAEGRSADPTRVVESLATEFAAAETPFLLVLDDVHTLTGLQAPHVLDRLMSRIPEGSAVVLAGRAMPAVHMARRRLSGNLTCLGPEDLQLDPEDAAGLLRMAAPAATDAVVDDLVERCEGWAAALALASLTIAEGAVAVGATGGVAATNGSAPHARLVFEYLHEEYLDQLDPSDRDLLVRSSVLDGLNGELCDEVLDRRDSAAVLERLASSGNLLVSGLQDGGRWYRCHALFRECLVDEMRVRSPRQESDLRVRAARWLSAHGYADQAMTQAIAANDLDLAAELAYNEFFICLNNGRVASMERWLGAFPPDILRRDPRLLVAAAWTDFVQRRTDDFEHRVGLMSALDPAHPMPDGSTLEFARLALVMMSGLGGVKESIVAAAAIVEAGPDACPWWQVARVVGTVCLWITGSLPDPCGELAQVEFDTRGSPAPNAVALAQLALARFWENEHEAARGCLERALEIVRAAGLEDYLLVTPVHAAHALIAAEQGAATESREAATRALHSLSKPWGLVTRSQIEFRLVLAEAAFLLDDLRAAKEQMSIVSPLLADEPEDVVLRDRYDELDQRLKEGATVPGSDPLTAAELRVLEQLRTHRSLEEIGTQLYVSRNTVKSHTIAIYRKLGVSSRGAAVEQAEATGLLEV
ncbi:MAG: hypothetical protein IT198_14530 [Acidimicrobiia bacterium]|nr:hypothetical protein [Acidimicrobiia bacterium]